MLLNLSLSISIYVPVIADERKAFLKQQMCNQNHRIIPPGSIMLINRGGVQLCVENPIFDG